MTLTVDGAYGLAGPTRTGRTGQARAGHPSGLVRGFLCLVYTPYTVLT